MQESEQVAQEDSQSITGREAARATRQAEKLLRRLQRRSSQKYDMNKEGSRFVKACNIVGVQNLFHPLVSTDFHY